MNTPASLAEMESAMHTILDSSKDVDRKYAEQWIPLQENYNAYNNKGIDTVMMQNTQKKNAHTNQSMWSIINTKNASNSRHIHSNNCISAAYYVKAPKHCGDIVFHDPRSAAVYSYPKVSKINKLNSNFYSIQPREGLLVMFPSFLHHSVDTNKSDKERIVISFNLNLK